MSCSQRPITTSGIRHETCMGIPYLGNINPRTICRICAQAAACVMDCSAIVRDLDLAFVLLPGQQSQKDIARWRPNWSCRQNSGRIAGSPKKGSFVERRKKRMGLFEDDPSRSCSVWRNHLVRPPMLDANIEFIVRCLENSCRHASLSLPIWVHE